MGTNRIEGSYLAKTPTSGSLIARARNCLPGGSTRTFGYHEPYPLVFDRGEGPYLWDVDGNQYVDLIYNGLSLIHGHAYPPVVEAIRATLSRGSGWLGSSREQIAFAELLKDRLPSVELARFTNTGTEAGMLAVKVARRSTGRSLILKAWAGYHGSYDDLEAGLGGQGELPGRTLLAPFGDADAFGRVLSESGKDIAAVVLEPVMYTGVVTPPPEDFLRAVQEAAHAAGALFVLDDCLMLRLAYGGSEQKFGLDPDLVFLGKFVGGGLPVGVVGGSKEVMSVLDPQAENHMYHGGSFNGNLLGCVAGTVAMGDLDQKSIDKMDEQMSTVAAGLRTSADQAGVPLSIAQIGSVMGVYIREDMPRPMEPTETPIQHAFHLACLNEGILTGPAGECALATVITDRIVSDIIERFNAAIGALGAELHTTAGLM